MSLSELTPVCGALGCSNAGYAIVNDPDHGEVMSCESCVNGREVIRHVE